MTDVLVVATQAIWPPTQGGQIRVAGLVEALAHHVQVTVAYPKEPVAGVAPVPVLELPQAVRDNGSLRHFLSMRPRLGNAALGRRGERAVRAAVEQLRPHTVLFTHSYLAAAMRAELGAQVIIDFANLEVQRMRSLAQRGSAVNRLSARFESLKADVWEPRTARRADLCIGLSQVESDQLRAWTPNVVTVPNGRPPSAYVRSPQAGPVGFLASADYAPNADAARWLMHEVWPRVTSLLPSAELRIAGRASDRVLRDEALPTGVEVVGEVTSPQAFVQECSLMLAPVNSGAGQQLKVIEAVASGRCLVATSFSAASVPATLARLVTVADDAQGFAQAVAVALQSPESRWAEEAAAVRALSLVPTWAEAVRPLVDRLTDGQS